jgi:ATP adenylyltransferase
MEHLWTPWRSIYVSKKPDRDFCVFCDALASSNDEQNLLLYRATYNFVILNRFPYSSGHLMIAPNVHVSRLTAIDAAAAEEMMHLARMCETILDDVYRPQGINLGMNMGEAAGAGIAAHIHLHILPRWTGDANFISCTAASPGCRQRNRSLQLGVFRLSFLENRDIAVGVLPKREEILVRTFRLRVVSR